MKLSLPGPDTFVPAFFLLCSLSLLYPQSLCHCSGAALCGFSSCSVVLSWVMPFSPTASLPAHNQVMHRCVPPFRPLLWVLDVDIASSPWCLFLGDPGAVKSTFPWRQPPRLLPISVLSLCECQHHPPTSARHGPPPITCFAHCLSTHSHHQQLSPTCNSNGDLWAIK